MAGKVGVSGCVPTEVTLLKSVCICKVYYDDNDNNSIQLQLYNLDAKKNYFFRSS